MGNRNTTYWATNCFFFGHMSRKVTESRPRTRTQALWNWGTGIPRGVCFTTSNVHPNKICGLCIHCGMVITVISMHSLECMKVLPSPVPLPRLLLSTGDLEVHFHLHLAVSDSVAWKELDSLSSRTWVGWPRAQTSISGTSGQNLLFPSRLLLGGVFTYTQCPDIQEDTECHCQTLAQTPIERNTSSFHKLGFEIGCGIT